MRCIAFRVLRTPLIRCIALALVAMPMLCGAVAARTGTRLVLVGGGDFPEEARRWFVANAGDSHARILAITWATEYPEETFGDIVADFVEYRPAEIFAAPRAPMTPEKRAEFLRLLASATGVFFSGGDQARIMDVLADTELADALRRRFREGVVFGGTSAGTAIMSDVMITGNGNFDVLDGSQVETRPGLGLLPADCIVDQHFIARRRQNRLLGLLMQHQGYTGIGIDEGTALIVEDNVSARAVGASKVLVIRPEAAAKSFALQVVVPGDRFTLAEAHTR